MRNRTLARCGWTLSCAALIGCTPEPLTIEPTELPAGVQGRVYSEVLEVNTDGDVSWEVSSGALPAGLALGPSGAISGSAEEAGAFAFTISARADTTPLPRTGKRSYTLQIIPRLALSVTLPAARRGEAYSATPSVSGGTAPYQFSVTGLPAGLSFDGFTGTISGTPVAASDGVRLLFRVFDGGQAPNQQSVETFATLVIKPPPVAIATEALPAGVVGAAYSATVTVTEGSGRQPFTWSVSAGVLPDGLRLNVDTGEISGTPTAAGSSTFTIRVRDSDRPSTTAQREFALDIAAE